MPMPLLTLAAVHTFGCFVPWAGESPAAALVPQEPVPSAAAVAPGAASFDLAGRRAAHWSWQPWREAEPPADAPGDWCRQPIDAFVAAELRAKGLPPAPVAEPVVLLRRLWFDLVGLPPPPAAVARFLADPSTTAYDREVDELLASPQFGERWARHWLDLVRYAETLGHEFDFELPNAWRYRDYVIRAIDADVPYDQFVRELVAGDLLPNPRRAADGTNESVQGTAAWWFPEQVHSPLDAGQHQSDRIDNQIDVLGKSVLGLTVACARCHDHKFDAIGTADYYALFGFVKSSRYVQAPLRAIPVDGAEYGAALAGQRDFAQAWGQAAAGTERPEWRELAARPVERWSAGSGFGPLRTGDHLVAAADGPADAWSCTNDGFGPAPWRGPWCPDPTAAEPELQLFPGAFWHSGIAGRHREGVLQTRTFDLQHRYLHVRAAGQHSRLLLVVDGFYLVRDPIYGELRKAVGDSSPHWVTFDTAKWSGRPAFLMCLDQRAQDLADPDHERSEYPEQGWLAVQAVVLSDHADPPPADRGRILPATPWSSCPDEVRAAARQLADRQANLPVSATLPALSDGTGSDEPVHVRGNHRLPGPLVARRFLAALADGEPMATGPGSGRLQLAEAILAADNPLPARVLANRVWHHLFGRGLARSVDNLGSLGDRPTHPELLDWLARDLVAHGWSLKHLVRRVVQSATYRQDSRDVPAAAAIDADNLLLHRQNVRRLEAEAVRDALLAVSGSLRLESFGPSVPIPLDGHQEARGKPRRSGPIDGDGRRSIYLALRRNFLPQFLQAFDLPTPFATVGARNVSNVPAQALALLNDPFVHLMCERWAARLQAAHGDDAEAWIAAAYQTAFGRAPIAAEREFCRQFLRDAAADATAAAPAVAAGAEDPAARTPLADLLHCLVNTKEFTFRR